MKNYFLLIFNFIILLSSTSLSQGSGLNVGANYILYPSNVNQSEVFITAHPSNPDILFASANTIVFVPFFVSEGIYVTTNGGNSWFGSDTCNGPNISFHQGDPGVAIDRYGRFILTRLGKQPFYGIYSHYSTDNGLNWSSQKPITTEGEFEKASIVSDNNPTSPYYGRTYATWVKLSGTFPVEFSFTDDISQSWSQIQIINSFSQRSSGPDIDIGNNGEVFITYALVRDVSPFNETAISFAKSSDGGNTWNVVNNIFPVNGINGTLPQKSNIRVNGLPRIAVDKSNSPTRGTIYIVTTQINLAPAGSDPDIILYKSTDSGQSWSDGIRVNQDALNNGKTQYFPAIDVDQYGGINIIYYDDRTTTNDSASVFLSRSTDGGSTWIDTKISDHNFKPQPIGGLGQGYQGDNIDIVSVGNKLFPVWMDNSTGIYQIWSAPILLYSEFPFIVSPSNLIAKADIFFVDLFWQDNSDNEVGFIIERKNGGIDSNNPFMIIDTVDANITHYTDNDLLPDFKYTYRVYAYNYEGVSDYSNMVEIKTLPLFTNKENKNILFQNFPNPFNFTTKIVFETVASSWQTLKVYDMIGNEVATLVDEFRDAGIYEVEFNVAQTISLCSGVYFYKLQAGSFVETKKMILIR